MLYTRVTGYAETIAPPGADCVLLTWDERQKRVLRVRTIQGREVGIRLERAQLKPGFVLEGTESAPPLWVGAALEPVLVVRASSPKWFAFAAHFIGNRHIPAWIDDEELLVREDRVLKEALLAHGISTRRELRALDDRVYMVSGGGHTSHGHGHGHGREHGIEHGHEHGYEHGHKHSDEHGMEHSREPEYGRDHGDESHALHPPRRSRRNGWAMG